jgi:predicted RNase H-like nuclease (RuvC/YqgF family)
MYAADAVAGPGSDVISATVTALSVLGMAWLGYRQAARATTAEAAGQADTARDRLVDQLQEELEACRRRIRSRDSLICDLRDKNDELRRGITRRDIEIMKLRATLNRQLDDDDGPET